MTMKGFLLVVCLILTYSTVTQGNAQNNVKTASKAIDKAATAIGKINDFLLKANPAQMFAQVSKVLVYLGPALMAASAIMSIVAIFLPEEDSVELKAINAGFEKVNLKLDIITTEIRDLKNIVELSSAKSTYIKCVTAIESNFETLQEAKQEGEKSSYDYFVKQYELTYHLAATNMYDAMTGKLGAFGFNLVNLYKDHVKCNPVLISKFCTLGIQIITKGLVVEGAYLGALNVSEKANEKQEAWQSKMQVLADSCQAIIQYCEDNWNVTASQHFRETYNKELMDNNQEFATKIAQAMNEVVPQRGWLVVSYNDAVGFSEHCYTSYYENEKIWDQHNKDVTIFSTLIEESSTGYFYDTLKKKIETQKTKLSLANDCRALDWMGEDFQHFGGNDVRTIHNYMREAFQGGVVYIVQLDKNPGVASTGNIIYMSDFLWKCSSKNYRIVIFI